MSNINNISQFSSTEYVDCPNLEGLLKKKNSHGQWKDRYCLFKKNLFVTYRPKGNKPSSEIKESIDLKDLDNIFLKDDILNLETCTGEVLLFRGGNINGWLDGLRLRSSKARQIYQKSLSENSSEGVHISGWLLKKSHNKYQGFQVSIWKVNFFSYFYYSFRRDL